MKVVVSGASGLVGKVLVEALEKKGHAVKKLVRKPPTNRDREIQWDPKAGTIDAAGLEGVDAIVHLAGENIAGGRWTEKRKRDILESRVQGTSLIARTVSKLSKKPSVVVSASAIGYYGNRGDAVMTEESAAGTGYLADVCKAWEGAAKPVEQAGVRLVHPRIGVVLAKSGGALKQMLLPFKMGVGGVVGSGKQYMSWVGLEELVEILLFMLTNEKCVGPINATAPNPATNRDFTKALGRALHRPTIFPMPAFAARLAFGELADELLLSSTRVVPRKLEALGYSFRHPNLDEALKAEINGNAG